MHKFDSDKSFGRYRYKQTKTLDQIENKSKLYEAKSPNSALVSDLPCAKNVLRFLYTAHLPSIELVCEIVEV